MPDTKQTLADLLAQPPMREQVVSDCVALVDGEVQAKTGLSGVAIKGAYGTVKKIKPRFVPEVIDTLLDEWIAKLEPYFSKWSSARSGTLTEFLSARSEDVAEDLLSVTDQRAENTSHGTVRKLYHRMRASAKANVMAAVPKLAARMEKRITEAGAGAA
jgi:hypothetical protein